MIMKKVETLTMNNQTIQNDQDFLIEKLKEIKDERIYEKPSDFIERVRYIPKGLSPKPGYFEFDFTPYLREPFDLLSPDSGINEIVLMKPAQIGYNVGILENAILYFMACHPSYVQFVTADKELAKEMVKERIDPMIDAAGLRHLIFAQSKRKGSKSTGDTILHKQWPGGAINFVGAKNPDAFRGRTRQILLLDEVDTYEDDAKEGSKLDIIRNRTNAFAESRKIIYGSTPLILQNSKIYQLYLQGDQRHYYINCPRCEQPIELLWHIEKENGSVCGIIFEIENNNPVYETVRYRCQVCEKDFRDEEKVFFLLGKGQWKPTAKPQIPGIASFWLNALYSPPGVYSWVKLVQDWSKVWNFEKNRIKSVEKYREWKNTKEGWPWEDRGQSISAERSILNRRTGALLGEIPEELMIRDSGSHCMLVTCAVDVQKTGLYVHVVGWCINGISWTIDWFKIEGDIGNVKNEVWQKLDKHVFDKRYVSKAGKTYKIAITLIDSGWGEHADVVYQFSKGFDNGVYAIKGEDYLSTQLVFDSFSKTKLEQHGLEHAYLLNTTLLKDRLSRYSRLAWETRERQPDWFCNYPEDLGSEFFNQLEAEEKVDIRDKITKTWKKAVWKNVSGADNHSLDTSAYNLAALEIVANEYCKSDKIGLKFLSYEAFWLYCMERGKGEFWY